MTASSSPKAAMSDAMERLRSKIGIKIPLRGAVAIRSTPWELWMALADPRESCIDQAPTFSKKDNKPPCKERQVGGRLRIAVPRKPHVGWTVAQQERRQGYGQKRASGD